MAIILRICVCLYANILKKANVRIECYLDGSVCADPIIRLILKANSMLDRASLIGSEGEVWRHPAVWEWPPRLCRHLSPTIQRR